MIFLCAQPDDYYFVWQLQILIKNLDNLKVNPNQIHILIGYNPARGIRDYFKKFADDNKEKASIFFYPDKRKKSNYVSSIRPNLIIQHYSIYEYLKDEYIFYHDSDIIFKELPNFELLKKLGGWYASDTSAYLNCSYIRHGGGDLLLKRMCATVKVDVQTVEKNDAEVNGAQYFIKGVTKDFWKNVEQDSEALYSLINSYNNEIADKQFEVKGLKRSNYVGVSSWYSDMWAFLWNAWKLDIKVVKNNELNFCWPYDHINEWRNNKILHYSGFIDEKNKKVFRKGNYPHYTPYYDKDLNKISPNSCSFEIVKIINQIKNDLEVNRLNLSDLTIIFPFNIAKAEDVETLYSNLYFINKYMNTRLLIIDHSVESPIELELLPDNCKYYSVEFVNQDNNEGKYDKILENVNTDYICICNYKLFFELNVFNDVFFSLKQSINDSIHCIASKTIYVDEIFQKMFHKILDINLLKLNIFKFESDLKLKDKEVIFLSRSNFKKKSIKKFIDLMVSEQSKFESSNTAVETINADLVFYQF